MTVRFAKASVGISPLLIGQVERFYFAARDRVTEEVGTRQNEASVANREKPHRTSLAIPAYILAAAAVEAFVNELFLSPLALMTIVEVPDETRSPVPSGVADALERLDLGAKLILVPHLYTGRSLDASKQPYQDMKLLAELRNHLVHYKMGWRPPKAVKVLGQRGFAFRVAPEEETGGPHPWADRVSTLEGIRWAYDTACATGRALLDLLPDDKRGPLDFLRENFRKLG